MIRPAEKSDLTDLVRLSGVLGYPTTEEELLIKLEATLADDRSILLVAEEDSHVRGFIEGALIHSLVVPPSFRVMGLVVDTDYQDQGIGGQLIEALEKEVCKRDYHSIMLTSGESRHLAHEFYEKHGYVFSHFQKKFTKEL